MLKVGARKAKSVNGIQQEPPLGGDCFWQFEKVLCPLNGSSYYIVLLSINI